MMRPFCLRQLFGLQQLCCTYRFGAELTGRFAVGRPAGFSLSCLEKREAEIQAVSFDANRGKRRRKLNRKSSNKTVGLVAPQGAPPKRYRKQKVDADAASMAPAPKNSIGTPLRIPYGNKEVALKLGARYGSEGWYAPPGVDLSAFGERGWLL
jgi:DNA topoisomerase-3